ncbi:hypothetical protein [Bacillus sp. JCM 19041]|uniref:hypothetical protein n=1 Tax=Bacillus sp. JCM 19041 TaxID=1460637 RepID=UPI0006CFF55C
MEKNMDEIVGYIMRSTEHKMTYAEVEDILRCYEGYKRNQAPAVLFEKDVEGIGKVKLTDDCYIDVQINDELSWSFNSDFMVEIFITL